MDLYVVDENFAKTAVVDKFSSLIWTDRYNAYGDVTLVMEATKGNRDLIKEGTFLHTPKSPEAMMLHTVNVENNVLTAQGFSLVEFLRQRLFRKGWGGNESSWVFSSEDSGDIMVEIMQALIYPGTYLIDGTVLTSGQGTDELLNLDVVSVVGGGSTIDIAVSYGDVYTALKQVADAANRGFSLQPSNNFDGSGTGGLRFMVTLGLDRTTSQTDNEVVIFDPAMDNLADAKELRSIQGYKNVAWVWPQGITSQSQIRRVYAPGATGLTLWQRRTLMVEASDINAPDYSSGALAAALDARGRDALANNNYVKVVDGQIVPQNAYTFGIDGNYDLGDIVELRGVTPGTSQAARVTEYIRTQDNTGEQEYPTLSIV